MIGVGELLYAAVLIGLGWYNWRATNIIVDLQDTLEEYNSIIVSMATELESLGSPNVKIVKDEVS